MVRKFAASLADKQLDDAYPAYECKMGATYVKESAQYEVTGREHLWRRAVAWQLILDRIAGL